VQGIGEVHARTEEFQGGIDRFAILDGDVLDAEKRRQHLRDIRPCQPVEAAHHPLEFQDHCDRDVGPLGKDCHRRWPLSRSLGIVRIVDENPRERALEIARTIALKNPHAIRAAKRLQAGMLENETDAILLEESIEQHAIMRSRNQVEAVMAEMERRKPNFEDL
jgi:hypothetical protein